MWPYDGGLEGGMVIRQKLMWEPVTYLFSLHHYKFQGEEEYSDWVDCGHSKYYDYWH